MKVFYSEYNTIPSDGLIYLYENQMTSAFQSDGTTIYVYVCFIYVSYPLTGPFHFLMIRMLKIREIKCPLQSHVPVHICLSGLSPVYVTYEL
jgi:hypothetical protein